MIGFYISTLEIAKITLFADDIEGIVQYSRFATIAGVVLGVVAIIYLVLYNRKAKELEVFEESATRRISFLKREYVKVFDENQKLHQTNGILEQQNKVLETQLDILKGSIENEEVS